MPFTDEDQTRVCYRWDTSLENLDPNRSEQMAMREPSWDETFWELMLDDIKDVIEDARRSRRKTFEQTVTMQNLRDTITITVKKLKR